MEISQRGEIHVRFVPFFFFVIEIDFNCTKIDSTKINLFPSFRSNFFFLLD